MPTYVPQPGDVVVHRSDPDPTHHLHVLAVGAQRFFARNSAGDELTQPLGAPGTWVLVPPSPPPLYVALHPATPRDTPAGGAPPLTGTSQRSGFVVVSNAYQHPDRPLALVDQYSAGAFVARYVFDGYVAPELTPDPEEQGDAEPRDEHGQPERLGW